MTIFAGDRAPKAFQMVLEAQPGVNFTTVTAWLLRVRHPDGTKATWAVDTVSGLDADNATLTHVFAADGSDLPLSGAYDIHALLTFASGELQSASVIEFVEDPYGTRV